MPERVPAEPEPAVKEERTAAPMLLPAAIAPAQRVLALQGLVGNRAVSQMLARHDPPAGMTSASGASQVAPGDQASTASPEQLAGRERLDKALKEFTQGNFKDIQETDWVLARPEEKMQLLEKATDPAWFWVGPGDELAIEACWRSFGGGFQAAVDSNPGAWTRSIHRGVDPENIPATKGKLELFKGVAIELATKNLDANEDTAIAEMKSWGLTPPAHLLRDPSKGGKSTNVGAMAPTPELKKRQEEQKQLARLVIRHERRLEELRGMKVGRGAEPFDPNIKPVEDWSLIPGKTTWEMVNEPWERTTAEIGLILNAWPVLYAAHGQDALDKLAFPETDEQHLGLEGLVETQKQLERTLEAISKTRAKVAENDDGYLDLVPVHRAIWQGKALSPAGNTFSRNVILPILNDKKAVNDDVAAAANLGIDLALMVAVLAGTIGTMGGAAIAIGIAGARAAHAEQKSSELGAAYGSALKDEGALVTKDAVTAAAANAEAAKLDVLFTVCMEAQGIAIHHLANPAATEGLGKRFQSASAAGEEGGGLGGLRAEARGMQAADEAGLAGSKPRLGGAGPSGDAQSWGSVPREQRPKQLEPLVNATLQSRGVRPVRVREGKLGNRFDHTSWTIELDSRFFSGQISQSEFDDMVKAMWHEADHAEVWYGMARAKAPEFKTPQELAEAMNLKTPQAIEAAIEAHGKPMAPNDPQRAEMLQHWENVYGKGKGTRNKAFQDLDAAEQHLSERETVFEVKKNKLNGASEKNRPQLEEEAAKADDDFQAARKRYDEAYKAYSELPEEARAFATEQWRGQWMRDAVRTRRISEARKRMDFWKGEAVNARAANMEAQAAIADQHADQARNDLGKALLM